MSMNVKLKIKAASLAAEARIIRKAERNQKRLARKRDPNGGYWHPDADSTRVSLYHHRTGVVRNEARATHLALGLLNCQPYRDIERSTREPMPDAVVEKLISMANKYGRIGNVNIARKLVTNWLI